MSLEKLHVAVIGGGLCGLSLAIALTKRGISHTIFESRGSFTEIGAGINLGPNTIQAFNTIDPSLSDAAFKLATRNEPGKEDIWMNVRLGAPTKHFEDARLIAEIRAPPTGNMTVSRNELLQMLAKHIDPNKARFNKKLVDFDQDDHGVTMRFEDGSTDRASVVIGCDGAHSNIRRLILGSDHPALTAKYTYTGGYRAVFPMEIHEKAIGKDKAHSIQLFIGPTGYVIAYPIDGGNNVNIGLWPRKEGEWTRESWIIPDQKAQMLEDHKEWGETVRNIMNFMGDETQFWGSFHHAIKPERYFKGRVCMIGDASHAMTPHQGQGAAQSSEDACVMAEVLQGIHTSTSNKPMAEQIEAAFIGYQSVRKPRFEAVLDTSMKNFHEWTDWFYYDMTAKDIEKFNEVNNEKFW